MLLLASPASNIILLLKKSGRICLMYSLVFYQSPIQGPSLIHFLCQDAKRSPVSQGWGGICINLHNLMKAPENTVHVVPWDLVRNNPLGIVMIMELSLLSATLGLAWPVNSILQCMERGNRLSDGVPELLAANILFRSLWNCLFHYWRSLNLIHPNFYLTLN